MVSAAGLLHLFIVSSSAVRFQGPHVLDASAAAPKGARDAHALPSQGVRPPFRLVLFKFQRTGSTFLMEALQQAVCRDAECRRHWREEIFTEICGEGQACKPEEAVRQVQRCSRCADGKSSCAWSLNLLRHGSMGLHVWEHIVKAISAQPTHVVFLTRRNVAAQFLSYKVGTVRREVMHRPSFYRLPGNAFWCNPFHFSACSRAQRDWVNERTSFQVDPKQLQNSIKEYERNNNIYAHLESDLRGLNNSNLSIMHLDYEDLFGEETWRTLFRGAGLTTAALPAVHPQSDYSRLISNWDEVVQLARTRGYNVTTV